MWSCHAERRTCHPVIHSCRSRVKFRPLCSKSRSLWWCRPLTFGCSRPRKSLRSFCLGAFINTEPECMETHIRSVLGKFCASLRHHSSCVCSSTARVLVHFLMQNGRRDIPRATLPVGEYSLQFLFKRTFPCGEDTIYWQIGYVGGSHSCCATPRSEGNLSACALLVSREGSQKYCNKYGQCCGTPELNVCLMFYLWEANQLITFGAMLLHSTLPIIEKLDFSVHSRTPYAK
ncbi:hypothetical protein EDC04DRAFT_2841342 [Pisolithus marmoratus]|nr:hypothetical protein EDC04DRAFT_2841342 [Pisolithus marmoratus]